MSRYPSLPAWRNLSHLLVNGWSASGSSRSLKALASPNTIELIGVIATGASRVAVDALPIEYAPAATETFSALLRGYGVVEVQILSTDRRLHIRPDYWPTEDTAGHLLLFTHSYERAA